MTTASMPHALALVLCNRAFFVFSATRIGDCNIVAWTAQWALSLVIGLLLIVGLAVMYEAMLRLLFVYAPLTVTAICGRWRPLSVLCWKSAAVCALASHFAGCLRRLAPSPRTLGPLVAAGGTSH